MTWRGRTIPSAYGQARDRAVRLWDSLASEPDPAGRQAVYRELGSAYQQMAEAWVPDDVPGGYDGDFGDDLGDMAALCHVLAASEEALENPGSQGIPLASIPGTAASSPLAAAWRQFWAAGNRADRAALLRGHAGDPAPRGSLRQPAGIIPLSAGRVGSVAAALLEAVAGIEEELAGLTPAGAAHNSPEEA